MNDSGEQRTPEEQTIRGLVGIGALCIGLAMWYLGLIAIQEAKDLLEDKTRLLLASLLLPLSGATIWLVANLAKWLAIVPSSELSPNV